MASNGRNDLMADGMESEDETKQLLSTVLETATDILQIRQRAEQEIRRTNEVLELSTRKLAQALVIMRATLEATTDAILVTDEKANVTEYNEKYIEMWKIRGSSWRAAWHARCGNSRARILLIRKGLSLASRKLRPPIRRASTCW